MLRGTPCKRHRYVMAGNRSGSDIWEQCDKCGQRKTEGAPLKRGGLRA